MINIKKIIQYNHLFPLILPSVQQFHFVTMATKNNTEIPINNNAQNPKK